MSTQPNAPATAKCRGTRWCPKGAATRCTRCGYSLCVPHVRETSCLKGGAHKTTADAPAPKPEPVRKPTNPGNPSGWSNYGSALGGPKPQRAPKDPLAPKGKRGPKRNEAKRALVLEALRAGKTTKQIAAEVKASPMLISNVRKEHGITTRATTTEPGPKPATTEPEPTKEKDMPAPLTEDQKQKIRAFRAAGKTFAEIAEAVGCSLNSANRFGKDAGEKPPRKSPTPRTPKPDAPKSTPASKRPTSVELTIRAAAIVECPGCSCAIVLDGQALDRLRAKVS